MARISKAAARKLRVPDRVGWAHIRHLASSRVPITADGLSRIIRAPRGYCEKALVEAEKMGWLDATEAGWRGRL